ncbi:MAG: hypothetical protein WC389_11810 [Lutibacter sp.]|jgi:hypothetical protein
METKEMTVKEFLTYLSTGNTSTEYDEKYMTILLHRCGFKQAVITCGIVYLEGQGSNDCPPMSINQIAQEILKRQ